MQIFENQQREEGRINRKDLKVFLLKAYLGKAIEHAVAKEILAGIVAAELIRLIETKGDDEIDKDAARQQAQDVSCTIYEQYYVVELNADEYDPNQYPQPDLN